MPKGQRKEIEKAPETKGKQKLGLDECGDSPNEFSPGSSPIRDRETPIVPRAAKKRPVEEEQDFGSEMQKMLEGFGGMSVNMRNKLHDEYCRQVSTVFQQWEADLEKTKEQEEKLTQLFKQQQKLFQQARIVQSQRLKTIRQLHDQYSKGIDDLDKSHEGQQVSVQSELKKEMALLQKRILMDTVSQHELVHNFLCPKIQRFRGI
ncbi:hypothetical protein FSP39_018020 [Pinctada imbricata]|uniref:XLR/SYCP3/FAM9 domain-containing protein n=1 Tax=Pinctada imbricata TaxID=66713 RepID=A0AA88YKB3_PINIB|nr:hypothetical protein FSP39_018020 [Pinctada imbricata]